MHDEKLDEMQPKSIAFDFRRHFHFDPFHYLDHLWAKETLKLLIICVHCEVSTASSQIEEWKCNAREKNINMYIYIYQETNSNYNEYERRWILNRIACGIVLSRCFIFALKQKHTLTHTQNQTTTK